MENQIGVSWDSLLNISQITAEFFDILKEQRVKFTLKEIDTIISPKLKKDILDTVYLDPENLKSNERVENCTYNIEF